MKAVFAVAVACALSACTTTKVTGVGLPSAPSAASSRVDVFLSPPQRDYEVIGIVSATKWKPGWTDPSVGDAVPQLQDAARKLGADGVIVRSSRSNNDRHVVVEAEAIRYKD